MNLKTSSCPRLPSLDGWRGVSILLVLGAHCKYSVGFPQNARFVLDWITTGDLGVRFFFVISGFLITHLLYQEYNLTGSISLQRFYIRRALRILPVYFAYLFVVFLLQVFTPYHQSLISWVGNLTFTTNYFENNWPTKHLWSLAVEEQFYLLWPLLLVLIGLKGNKRAVFYILGIALIIAPIWRLISYAVTQGITHAIFNVSLFSSATSFLKGCPEILPLFNYFSFLNFFDSLAIGCIAAILLTKHEAHITAVFKKVRSGSILLGLALILIPYFMVMQHYHFFMVLGPGIPFGNTCQAVGFAILLLQSILSPQLFKPLNWPVVKQLGVLSYSIYIWQQLFCSDPQTFGFTNVWFMTFPGWILAACLVAMLSYYGLEKPLMGLRAYFRKPAAG